MKNIDRQRSLDKKKWDESMIQQCDMSGKMNYCSACNYSINSNCVAPQESRMDKCLCAKAFNRTQRK